VLPLALKRETEVCNDVHGDKPKYIVKSTRIYVHEETTHLYTYREKGRERERERERVGVCMCVCENTRERERENGYTQAHAYSHIPYALRCVNPCIHKENGANKRERESERERERFYKYFFFLFRQ